jgi:hypothetical protein
LAKISSSVGCAGCGAGGGGGGGGGWGLVSGCVAAGGCVDGAVSGGFFRHAPAVNPMERTAIAPILKLRFIYFSSTLRSPVKHGDCTWIDFSK